MVARYQVNNFKHLMLNIILVDEGQNLLLDRREISNLKDRWSLIVVFIEECDDQHLEVRVDIIGKRLK